MNAILRGVIDFAIPTHLLAAVALGLLAGQSARRFPFLPLIALAFGLILGSLAIAHGLGETPAAMVLLVLAAVGAAFVAAAWSTPAWIATLLAVLAGAMLPLNAPPHAITIANAIAEQIGFAAAALATFSLISIIAIRMTRPWQRIGVRIIGSWIVASAMLVVALKLAR
jgi:urease accessory protein